MAMSKAELRQWPNNDQPSNRHVWQETNCGAHASGGNWHSASCKRCGCSFNSRADTRGPVYCYPSQAWLAAHPSDDGALGDNATGQACGEYGRPLRR